VAAKRLAFDDRKSWTHGIQDQVLMPRVLDQDEIDQFQRDGFLSFLSNVPPAELKLIRDTLVELHEKGTGFSEGAQFDAMGIDDGEEPRRFPQILHPRSFATHLVRTEFFRTAHDIARQLLGDNVRFSADISLMKPARIGSPTPWHQDEAYHNPNFEYREVSFWLALQPTDQMNSCMAYIPGSHLGEVLTHDFPGGDSRVHALECVDGFDPRAAIVCPVPRGGCIIHAGRTLHFAGPNISDTDRYAYAVIFTWCQRRRGSRASFRGAGSRRPLAPSGKSCGADVVGCWFTCGDSAHVCG
jgi:hypothetical protein